MSPCSRRSAGARAAGARAAPVAPETVCGLCRSAWQAPGAFPALSSRPFPAEGGCCRPAPSPSPRSIHGHAPRHGPARRPGDFPASDAAARFPAHTTGGLFAELPLIYGPCYLNINYGPGRQAPRLLPSRLIIF